MSKYIFNLLVGLFFCLLNVSAQEAAFSSSEERLSVQEGDNTQTVELEKQVNAVYQGLYLNVDIFNPISGLFNGGFYTFEVSTDVSLWHKLFPALEVGVGFSDQEEENYRFKTNGLYMRTGAGFNLMNTNQDRKRDHAFIIGARYAYGHQNYQLSNAVGSSDYWGEEGRYNSPWTSSDAGWAEFLFGVRVELAKGFFMGFNARVKTFLHFYQDNLNPPSYISGFGSVGKSTNFGLDYNLSYRFPYKNSQNR